MRVSKASNLPRIIHIVTKELNLNSDLLSLKPKLSASFHSGLPNVVGRCLRQDWVKGGRQRLRPPLQQWPGIVRMLTHGNQTHGNPGKPIRHDILLYEFKP